MRFRFFCTGASAPLSSELLLSRSTMRGSTEPCAALTRCDYHQVIAWHRSASRQLISAVEDEMMEVSLVADTLTPLALTRVSTRSLLDGVDRSQGLLDHWQRLTCVNALASELVPQTVGTGPVSRESRLRSAINFESHLLRRRHEAPRGLKLLSCLKLSLGY